MLRGAALIELVGKSTRPVAPPDRQPPLLEQLELLTGRIHDVVRANGDHDLARHPDAQGIGVEAGLKLI